MKFLTSALLLVPLLAWGNHRPIVISHYHPDEAENIAAILRTTYHIPADFITVQLNSDPCGKLKENISWHLCVDANGDLFEVHADVAFIKQTLRIFL